MQLTYNLQNYIGCGYWEENDSGISSRFGRKCDRGDESVGILIDLSHCGERTTLGGDRSLGVAGPHYACESARVRRPAASTRGPAEDDGGDEGARATSTA
jgi:hypothetical protein